jgi:nicotinamidase/pyrazinamidase
MIPRALLVIDVQCDFLPGGALAVPLGDQIISPINDIQPKFDLVVATQDWHPSDHGSFADQHDGRRPGEQIVLDGLEQILWPRHCVQLTHGAQLAGGLDTSAIRAVFKKGTNRRIDSYSGFFDNARRQATGLADLLADEGVTSIFLVGLATDYCVKFTALDGVSLGFGTTVIGDCCRGVNLRPDDSRRALEELHAAGVRLIDKDGLDG